MGASRLPILLPLDAFLVAIAAGSSALRHISAEKLTLTSHLLLIFNRDRQKQTPVNKKLGSSPAVLVVLFGLIALTSASISPNTASRLRARSQSGSSRTRSARSRQANTLTFADRVRYQRAIEEVYRRHSIWPKERPDAKPPLDAVISRAQLEKKVEDYLRDSQVLQDDWQRPITHDELQAEIDRMGHRTKQPHALHEILQALGNDPLVIAECVARPILAKRLIMQLDNERTSKLTTTATKPPVTMSPLNANYTLPAISNPSGTWTDDT